MNAAIYLRSSKDRNDVSLDAQRRELVELAKSKNLIITDEFSDAVESGKDDQRPGFQSLLASLNNKNRKWSYLLALDTSRIARNQYFAHALHHECEVKNIKVIYAKIPETGSHIDIMIRSIMQAFDQLHSLMSKEKGLAGMAENVKQGFRAGGRAPFGYKFEIHQTGAIRDGEPVTKTKLIPSDDFNKLQQYFKFRLMNINRSKSALNAGLQNLAPSSLIGMECTYLCRPYCLECT